MFKELAPLLRQRCVVMTLTCTNDDIRVAVVPKKLKESENVALTTPFEVQGTAEELDEQLPAAFSQLVGAHLELSRSLQNVKEIMEDAAKKAKAEAKEKAASTTATNKPTAVQKSAAKPAKPVAEKKEEKKPTPPRTASLFDFSAPPMAAATPAPVPAAIATEAPADEDEEDAILSEIADDAEEEDDDESGVESTPNAA